MPNLPDVSVLTESQTAELLGDCMDNLGESKMLDVLFEKLTKDEIDELAARAEDILIEKHTKEDDDALS